MLLQQLLTGLYVDDLVSWTERQDGVTRVHPAN